MTIADGQAFSSRNLPTRRRIGRALFNTLMSAAGFAVCVVVPAATWTWPQPWVKVGVFVIVHVIGTLRIVRNNPDLLPERARVRQGPGQPIADKVLLYVFTASYAAMIMVSSADG